MDLLLKRNQTKSIFGFGKKVRFFVLDFYVQKFYYKQDQHSQDIKFICNFNQIEGMYKFIVDEKYINQYKQTLEATVHLSNYYADEYGGLLDDGAGGAGGVTMDEVLPMTEKELEAERNLKWNYGIELYFQNRVSKARKELFVVYFQTQKKQKLWADRFDRIIQSNKNKMVMRMNRKQRSVDGYFSTGSNGSMGK